MKRRDTALAAAFFVALGATLFFALRGEKPMGPAAVPMGETVKQIWPDAEGNPVEWTISKKQIAIEDLPEPELPTADQRTTPENERTESARTLNSMARDALRRAEIRRAVKLFEQAVEADPDDGIPHSDYGRFMLIATDYSKALPHLERAAELRPDDPQVWVDLLTLYERTVQIKLAWDARARATELADGRRIVQDDRGIYMLEGNVFP